MPEPNAALANQIHVSVVFAPAARTVIERQLLLPRGTTVVQALQACPDAGFMPALQGDSSVAGVGIWGRKCRPDQVLREHDRIEIYRTLQVDPKLARRERFKQQGTRSAGLFAKRRANSKAGY